MRRYRVRVVGDVELFAYRVRARGGRIVRQMTGDGETHYLDVEGRISSALLFSLGARPVEGVHSAQAAG